MWLYRFVYKEKIAGILTKNIMAAIFLIVRCSKGLVSNLSGQVSPIKVCQTSTTTNGYPPSLDDHLAKPLKCRRCQCPNCPVRRTGQFGHFMQFVRHFRGNNFFLGLFIWLFTHKKLYVPGLRMIYRFLIHIRQTAKREV